jgi:ferric-dicitrate binding protein FerR (iron transport regulator)
MENDPAMATPLSDQLLFDYFAGKATALQRKVVAEWLADPANAETYYRLLCTYETQLTQLSPRPAPTVAELERRFFLLSTASTSCPEPVAPAAYRLNRLLWLAASVLLLAGVSWLTLTRWQYQTHRADFGQTRTVRLADGSLVTLNANSTLRVPRLTFGWHREVWLQGEAEFTVKKLPDRRNFRVHTPHALGVEVLGTTFVLYARPRGSRVVLTEGKLAVHVGVKNPSRYLLRPNDVLQVDAGGRARQVQVAQTQSFTDWKVHTFAFHQTPLREVAQRIHERFGTQVTFADSALASQTLSGTFDATSADELIRAIQILYQYEARRPAPQHYHLESTFP